MCFSPPGASAVRLAGSQFFVIIVCFLVACVFVVHLLIVIKVIIIVVEVVIVVVEVVIGILIDGFGTLQVFPQHADTGPLDALAYLVNSTWNQ